MPARVFLMLILLLHPLRGALAIGPARPGGATDVCVSDIGDIGDIGTAVGVKPGTDCCPLCAAADTCPCSAGPDSPMPAPEPAIPSDGRDMPRVAPSGEPLVLSDLAVSIASPRAPPAGSLRSLDATVGQFLSRVCLWTV